MNGSGSKRALRRRWPFNGARAVGTLRVLWLVAVLWYESGVFYWSTAICRWPDNDLQNPEASKATHVLLIADPQVLDMRSYPDRSWLLSKLTQFVVDLNMRKSWGATRRFRPDAIVFLGDMMDNGRFASDDDEYKAYYERFRSIFTVDPSTSVLYIPGNHDVGLGSSKSFSPQSRKRYKAHFGPVNRHVSIANHTIVLLDAPGLVEEDYRRAASGMSFDDWSAHPGGAIDYLRKFAGAGSEEPVVLFTHIPLFRPDTATCGPLRERGSIHRGVGFGYQNTLGRQTSEYILKGLRPAAVFSGDDHDYCEYTHSIPLVDEGPEPRIQYVREVTVKSFSMAMGIQRPGFHMLSLASESVEGGQMNPERTYADAPCFLPNQLAIYMHRYLPLFLLSVLLLALSNFRKSRLRQRTGRQGSLHLSALQSTSSGSASAEGAGMSRRRESGVWTLANPFNKQRSRSPSPLSGARTPRLSSTPSTIGGSANGNGNWNGNGYAPPKAYRASPLPSPGLLSASTPAMIHAFERDDEHEQEPYAFNKLPLSHPSHALRRIPGDEDLEDDYFSLTSGRHRRRQRHNLAWSWTFVFRGRRRRFTVGVPPALQRIVFSDNVQSLLYGSATSRRRPCVSFFADVIAVAWPPVVLFTLICIVMFW